MTTWICSTANGDDADVRITGSDPPDPPEPIQDTDHSIDALTVNGRAVTCR